MTKNQLGISRRSFIFCIIAIIVGISAFAMYQAVQTDGVLFYTTNVDEASHLSYWYANYVVEDSGRLRPSSRLVRFLHQSGLSGGYINFLFDIGATLIIIFGFNRIFQKIGLPTGQARIASILAFILPALFTCFNPVVEEINIFRLQTDLVRWLSLIHI